ncbi:amidoligase family protein [Leucothrix mucor]|uniref:amidoligase family protein n=1 Tax=Leucothrix mucor TaxID=45248 RepID=UPI0003B452CF|nr:amidoligase family protein [Leucothrix mucor]
MSKVAEPVQLAWKIGIEVELLAPLGRSRLDLAQALADQCGGHVQRFFHPQSEPSQVAGAPVFENLTLGFKVLDAQGQLVANCVDDLTLQKDLVRQRLPRPDWYRIVSDDSRMIRLIMRQADASETCTQVLEPLAELFGSELAINPDGMVRLSDDTGMSIAIAAPLPGERERPCELITVPIEDHHHQRLEGLLSVANKLEFYVPVEGATHIHFDAEALCSASVLANLINVLQVHGAGLRRLVGANANCTRLGDWPDALYDVVKQDDFIDLTWEQVQAQLSAVKLTKFCDFNIKNMIEGTPDKHTFEVRIFPVWLEAEPILEAAGLFEAILNWAIEAGPVRAEVPSALSGLLETVPMNASLRDCWLNRLA